MAAALCASWFFHMSHVASLDLHLEFSVTAPIVLLGSQCHLGVEVAIGGGVGVSARVDGLCQLDAHECQNFAL